MEKIEIRAIERPDENDPVKMIRWFCATFGMSGSEEDSIEEQILKDFVFSQRKEDGLASSEIQFDRVVARSTVIYHLNRFIDAGMIVKKGRRYYLRANEMSKVIEEIEYDIEREMKRMIDTAKEFDRMMEGRLLPRKKR